MPSRRSRRHEFLVEIEDVPDGKPDVTPKSHYEICCDCGLVHDIKIKKHPTDPRKVIMISTREDVMTEKYRKKMKIQMLKGRFIKEE